MNYQAIIENHTNNMNINLFSNSNNAIHDDDLHHVSAGIVQDSGKFFNTKTGKYVGTDTGDSEIQHVYENTETGATYISLIPGSGPISKLPLVEFRLNANGRGYRLI